MSTKILHFLNGDATLHQFRKTNLPGDCAVIRETFCFGPLVSIEDPQFWHLRKNYFQEYYSASIEEYDDRILSEFRLAKNDWDEICIWYEYDVYCQINMLFVVTWCMLQSNSKLSLVYSDIGMGRENVNNYKHLFLERKMLTKHDIDFLRKIWNSIVESKFEDLQEGYMDQFPNLYPALLAFIEQFHAADDRPPIQSKILKFLNTNKSTGKHIVKHLLTTDEIYGFGDLQYLLLLGTMDDVLDFPEIEKGSGYFDRLLNTEYQINKKGQSNDWP